MILTHGSNSIERSGYAPSSYVQIGNQLWDTKNLGIELGTEGVNQLTHPWIEAGKLYTIKCVLENLTTKDGWRVPTNQDFNNLRTNVTSLYGSAYRPLVTTNSNYANTPGTNESGFNALICGYAVYNSSEVRNIKASVNFWTSTLVQGSLSRYYDWCLENGSQFNQLSHNESDVMLCIRLCKDA